MTSLRFLPLTLLACLTIGCRDYLPVDDGDDDDGRGGDGNGVIEDVIMPLAEGNTWYGEVTGSSDGGITFGEKVEETIQASGSWMSEDGTETWFQLYVNGMPDVAATNLEDGLYAHFGGPRCLRAKYPGVPGELFNYDSTVTLIGRDPSEPPLMQTIYTAVEIVSTDTVITVPAGTFTCYLYHPVLLGDVDARLIEERYDFYAPGIGPIRTDFYSSGTPADGFAPDRQWQLVSYILN